MHINFLLKNNKLYAKIIGELDHHSAVEIREQIDGKVLSDGVSTLIFDLSELVFMDSSGIGVIIGRYKLMKSIGGEVYIVSSNKTINKLLLISGVPDIIKIADSVSEIEEIV